MVVFQAKIRKIRHETVDVRTFFLSKPDNFMFYPGQYCWINLPGFEPSPMAIASGQHQDSLAFTIRTWGELTHELFKKKVGNSVTVDGPHGTYLPLEKTNNAKIVYMIAGGTGITPIRSLVYSLSGVASEVYYGAKNPKALLYNQEIDGWPTQTYLTVDDGGEDWDGHIGLVTELLKKSELNPIGLCFVCGPLAMERATVNYLRATGFNDANIYVSLERFDEEGNVVGPVLPVTDSEVEF